MATTFVDYTGDGNATKAFSFPSIKEADIKVDVDGVLKTSGNHYNITSYSTTGGGNVVFTSGNIPASPAQIRIYRDTDVDSAKASFTAGSSIKAGDLNANNKQLLYAAQEEQNQTILATDIKDGVISAAKLANDSVTTAKIADANVTTAKIADDAVTADKLANSINTEIAANTAKTTNQTHTGDVTGATSLTIANAAVTNAKIANDAINSDKIANDAVNSEHYAAGSIDTEHIDDLQVTTAKIANDAIVVGKIADNAVTTAKISDGNITTAKIADDAITSAKLDNSIDSAITANTAKVTNATHTGDVTGSGALTIANDAVTTAKIADDAVTADKIANTAVTAGTYTTADITVDAQGRITSASSGNISEAEIANSAVTTAKIAADAVTTAKIAAGAVTTAKIADDAVTSAKLAGQAVNTAAIATGAVVTGHLAGGSVTSAKIQDGTITQYDIADSNITTAKIADDAVTNAKIADGTLDGRYYTETELDAGQLDNRYYTEAEADARFYNLSSGEEIQSGETWSAADNKIATTAAIDARILDLVDDVGGFVPIANETSFPNANPDAENGTGTIVSVSTLASNHTSNSSGVITISNGTVGNSTVTITGAANSTTYSAGYGLLVETTSTLNTYTFHRLVPKATEVTTVAQNATNIAAAGANTTNINTVAGINSNVTTVAGISGNVTTVAGVASNVTTVAGISSDVTAVANDATDIGVVAGKATEIGRLGTADAVADMNTLGTTAIVSDMDTLADISSNITTVANNSSNVTTVAGISGNVTTVAGNNANITTVAGANSNISTVAGSIANVNTTASNIGNVNNFANTYQIASSNPSTDGGGNSLAAGDLYFNTSSNELKVYNGSAWQGGVTATGSLAGLTANTFTGTQTIASNRPKIIFTENDANPDYSVFVTAGKFTLKDDTNDVDRVIVNTDGHIDVASNVDFASGIDVTGNITVSGTVDGVDIAALNSTVSGITSNATHSGEVTGSTALTIADNVVDEANLKVSNSPTNGYFLQAQSGNTGGLTWAEVTSDLVGDTTPQLGGNLDVNSKIIEFGDSSGSTDDRLKFGAHDDLQIYHDGSHSYIKEDGTGSLRIQSNQLQIQNADGTVALANFTDGVAVQLLHGGTRILETESTGILVDTDSSVTRVKLQSGANTIGSLRFHNDNLMLETPSGGSSQLTYGGSTKLETTNTGVTVTGTVAATSYTGDGSNLTGIAAGVTSDDQYNTVAGTNAGDSFSGTDAEKNTLYGYDAGTALTAGDRNTAIGYNALKTASVNSAKENVAVGYRSLEANTTGYGNTAIGAEALIANTTGDSNVAVGYLCGIANTTSGYNVAIGNRALYNNTTQGGHVAIGGWALNANTQGSQLVAIGYGALTSNTSGVESVAIGSNACYSQQANGYNTGVGWEALYQNTASYNAAFGRDCFRANTSGGYNTGLGDNAASSNTTGSGNTVLGASAGTGLTTGSNNIFLGYNATNGVAHTGSNCIVIGQNATISALGVSNEITLGNSSITKLRVPGINVTLKDNGGTPTEGHVLTVDSNGEAGFAAVSTPAPTTAQVKSAINGVEIRPATVKGSGNLRFENDSGLGFELSNSTNLVYPLHDNVLDFGSDSKRWKKAYLMEVVATTRIQSPFYENSTTVSSNYTVTNGYNAMAAGPLTIASGVTVTVGSGETLTIV